MILGIFNGWLDPVYIGVVGYRASNPAVIQKRGFEDLSHVTHVRVNALLPVQQILTDDPTGIKHVVLKDDAQNVSYYLTAGIERIAIGFHEIDLVIVGKIVIPGCQTCRFYNPDRIIDRCEGEGFSGWGEETDCEYWREKE